MHMQTIKKPSVGKKAALIFLVLTIISLFVVDYITLPALNFQSFNFWILLAIYSTLFIFFIGTLLSLKGCFGGALIAGVLIMLVGLAGWVPSWIVWPGSAARYYGQLKVSERPASSFAKDFPDINLVPSAERGKVESLITPRTDKELSQTIAQGKVGTYGARFQMTPQIFTYMAVHRNDETEIVRVSPLDYTGFMVALTGGAQGTAGYIEVNQISEEGKLVTVPGGLKYTPNAVFNRRLERRVRFQNRTRILGEKSFEIDDSGKPYWVFPVLKNTIGFFSGSEQNGVILADPVSGQTKYYRPGEEPLWVDRAMPTDMVVTQANHYLRYKNGWVNTAFGQKKDIFQLSDSYNYVVSDGPGGSSTWLMSGVTSPSESDQTLVGFMMINLKTKEARRYDISGITEMRAKEIAQNDERVRAQNLEATWPILVNVGGENAYYLFLKNNVQRQRFVYIDVATGQKVAMSDNLETAKAQFEQLLGLKLSDAAKPALMQGVVLRVRDSPSDDKLLFLLQGQPDVLYSADINLSNGVKFMAPGDRVELSYRELPATTTRRFVVELRNLSLGEQP